MKVALDTNVLAYAEGIDGAASAGADRCLLLTQDLQEEFTWRGVTVQCHLL